MKRVLTSAGLLALGASSMYALDPAMSRQNSGRLFTVAATVRGFYDDNIHTSPDKIVITTGAGVTREKDPREESFGFQVSPSVHLNLPFDQTFISLGYTYTLNWYERREPHETDQSHEFSARLRHQFSPRHQISVDDTFLITSEPTAVQSFGIVRTPVRVRTEGDVYQNVGSIDDTFQLTSLWGLSFGYVNTWVDYEADGVGSRSALLDRMEHLFRADARYQFNPKLVGIVGYTFGFTTFTGDEEIGRYIAPSGRTIILESDYRDSTSHYAYIGVDYDITAKLRASVRVGAQFSDYSDAGENSANPYADASLSYAISAATSVEAGIRHSRAATDVSGIDTSGDLSLDAEVTAVYAALHHRILRDLTGSLLTQYQISSYDDGVNDGESERLLMIGVNFEYHFNRHFSADIGYNFDHLDSDLKGTDRSYDRNRFYVGLKATY
jgi:hypothetical protein